jgi:hypothetical protein
MGERTISENVIDAGEEPAKGGCRALSAEQESPVPSYGLASLGPFGLGCYSRSVNVMLLALAVL